MRKFKKGDRVKVRGRNQTGDVNAGTKGLIGTVVGSGVEDMRPWANVTSDCGKAVSNTWFYEQITRMVKRVRLTPGDKILFTGWDSDGIRNDTAHYTVVGYSGPYSIKAAFRADGCITTLPRSGITKVKVWPNEST